jgi:uncharacterized protein YwgA
MANLDDAHEAAAIVRDAGGQIVGRTRLQKIAFVLEAAGLGSGFPFRYKHYGPYSEQLTAASQRARVLGVMREIESVAAWGGVYSTFTATMPQDSNLDPARRRLAQEMVNADAVELELAATALFLSYESAPDPWGETEHRKPDKAANGRLDRAKQLYQRLRRIQTPQPLPEL